jgi:hypothetical protein
LGRPHSWLTGMVAELSARWNWGVEARNLEIGVRGWRPVALHVDEPGRWHGHPL